MSKVGIHKGKVADKLSDYDVLLERKPNDDKVTITIPGKGKVTVELESLMFALNQIDAHRFPILK